MSFTSLENVLWAASFVGHAALLLVLVSKRRWREFPVFTALIAYQAGVTAMLYLIHDFASRHAYFLGYWTTAFADYAFQVALIVEIARNVLRPTGTWVQGAWKSFLLWSFVGTALAVGLAFTISSAGSKGLDVWEVRLTVFTALLTCELFLAMSTAANRLGLPWRSHVMAIGQGLTVWAAFALLGDLGHVLLGWERQFAVFDYVSEFAYVGVLVFWGVSFWLPERARAPLSADMQEYLVALHRRVQYDLDRARVTDKPLL